MNGYREEGEDDDEEAGNQEEKVDVKIVETAATFDGIMVWEHGTIPEDDDAYVKGITEWIGFAEAVSTDE